MKLLIIYADRFGYKTSRKGLEEVEELNEEKKLPNWLVNINTLEIIVSFNAADNSSGIYFYRLKSGSGHKYYKALYK